MNLGEMSVLCIKIRNSLSFVCWLGNVVWFEECFVVQIWIGLMYGFYVIWFYVVYLLGLKEILAIWLIFCRYFLDEIEDQRGKVIFLKLQSNWESWIRI